MLGIAFARETLRSMLQPSTSSKLPRLRHRSVRTVLWAAVWVVAMAPRSPLALQLKPSRTETKKAKHCKKPTLVGQRLGAELELRNLDASGAGVRLALTEAGVHRLKDQEQLLLAEAISGHVALFGQHLKRSWTPNYIPPQCVGPQKGSVAGGSYVHAGNLFDRLRSIALRFSEPGIVSLDRQQGIWIGPELHKNPGLWREVVFGALSHAGPNSGQVLRLGLRKQPPRHRRVRGFLDLEWRRPRKGDGRFTGAIEVAVPETNTRGTVRTADRLAAWMQDALVATGVKTRHDLGQLAEARDVFKLMPGHLNWSAEQRHIDALPSADRLRYYQSQVGLWETASSAYFVEILAASVPSLGQDGLVHLTTPDVTANRALENIDELRHNPAVRPVMRGDYERYEATDRGIKGPELTEFDREVDWCFGPMGKSHPVGLRSVDTTAPNQPAPARLEVRAAPTLSDAFRLIPLPTKGRPDLVDLEPLFTHASSGHRGLAGSYRDLTSRIDALWTGSADHQVHRLEAFVRGLPTHLADNFSAWNLDELRALYLLPLTDWLAHPHVSSQLARQTPARRHQLKKRFLTARNRYAERLGQLVEAISDESIDYAPAWAAAGQEGAYGVHNPYSIGSPPYKPINRLQRQLLLSLAGVFAAESGLANFMAMWGIYKEP